MPASEIMHKFKEGTLHSGSSHGPIVHNRKQAIAIKMSYDKKEHKKNNSARHAHLNSDGTIKVSHHEVCSHDYK